jgi:1-acyl-sn-glycerol-3-phosphate acyltransferase
MSHEALPQTSAPLIAALRFLFRYVAGPLFRVRVEGIEHVPATGGCLILPNHHGALDPFWVAQEVPRPVHFMASSNLFRRPWMAAGLHAVGAFRKEKYVRDAASTRTVEALVGAGRVVCLFMEGRRTWDGRMSDPGDGIGHLVARLGVPVVPVRLETAFHWQPRWARWPRWVPVRITFLPPVRYDPKQDAHAITQDLCSLVATPAHPRIDGPSFGFRMAEGLEAYLWACPGCFAVGATGGRGDVFSCRACGASWKVGLDARLTGATGSMTIAEAFDGIMGHFGDPPVEDPARFASEGVIAAFPGCALGRLSADSPRPTPITAGTLVITERAVEVRGAATVRWSVPLGSIQAAPMEMGNAVTLRVVDGDGVARSISVDLGGGAGHRLITFLRGPLEAAHRALGRRAPRVG